jgi:2-oxo-4-hydroxy-4-carboxy-5-ureidoimidazoline decarboxylase
MSYSLVNLNQMSQNTFVDSLGTIFEHTPEIPAQVWHQRPFQSVEDLHTKMAAVVDTLPQSAKMMLVFAHPDLGSKMQMTATSVQEQADAGLNQLTRTEYLQFKILNQTYRDKFGFPFIIAVKKQTKESILAAFAVRLQNTVEVELQQAIAEIIDIAWFRLIETVTEF